MLLRVHQVCIGLFCFRAMILVIVSNKPLNRENAIAIESEAKYPFGGNVYYVTMQITLHIPEFARKERNLHCDVVHITTKWVFRLMLLFSNAFVFKCNTNILTKLFRTYKKYTG